MMVLILRPSALAKENFLGLLGHAAGIWINRARQSVSALDRRALLNRLEPAFEIREIIQVLPLPFVQHDPRITGHIRDGIGSANKFSVAKPFVEHAVKPLGFFGISLDRVSNFLVDVTSEVMILTEHRAEPAHLPEKPLHHLLTPARSLC